MASSTQKRWDCRLVSRWRCCSETTKGLPRVNCWDSEKLTGMPIRSYLAKPREMLTDSPIRSMTARRTANSTGLGKQKVMTRSKPMGCWKVRRFRWNLVTPKDSPMAMRWARLTGWRKGCSMGSVNLMVKGSRWNSVMRRATLKRWRSGNCWDSLTRTNWETRTRSQMA